MSTSSSRVRNRAWLLVSVVAVVAMLLVATPSAKAQTENDFQLWTALFFTGHAVPGARGPVFWFDAHARRGNAGTLMILRPGLGYAFASWASVWVGYAWTPVFLDETSERVATQGVCEQLTLTYRQAPRLVLQARTRFEQFWSDAGPGMFPRLRQFMRANYRPSEGVPVGLALWDEVFFGLKSTAWASAGFFENRIFAGLAIFAVEDRFRVETGYMFVNAIRGQGKILKHVLAINLFVTFKPS